MTPARRPANLRRYLDFRAFPTGETMDFQTLILKLSEYWASRGCLIEQPYDT